MERSPGYRRGVAPLRAVVFDVDFTIAEPGPDLGAEGYRRIGERYGLALDPRRHHDARRSALETLERHPELAAFDELREHGLKVGLLSNTARDLDLFVAHHGLRVDALLTSRTHGKTKPHESIFLQLLGLLGVAPTEAVMVGDSVEDDIEGAQAVGMRALLVDRERRYPDRPDRVEGLAALPAALGL